MTITQLIYFVAVAEELNITRIAERFHVSQPAVSQAIRDLEKEFQLTLFERRHNDLLLTATGNTAYQQAKRLLEHYKQFQSDLGSLQVIPSVSIAIAPNIAAIHLADMFLYFQKNLPDVTIHMQENYIINMTHLLKNNLLDAALFSCSDDSRDPALTYIPVGYFSLLLCASPSFFGTEEKLLSPQHLEGTPIVLQFERSQLNSLVFKYLSHYQVTPKVILYANQLITICEFVRNGIAAGFLPPQVIDREAGIEPYRLSETEQFLENRTVYFVYRKKSPIVGKLLRVISDYFELV